MTGRKNVNPFARHKTNTDNTHNTHLTDIQIDNKIMTRDKQTQTDRDTGRQTGRHTDKQAHLDNGLPVHAIVEHPFATGTLPDNDLPEQ